MTWKCLKVKHSGSIKIKKTSSKKTTQIKKQQKNKDPSAILFKQSSNNFNQSKKATSINPSNPLTRSVTHKFVEAPHVAVAIAVTNINLFRGVKPTCLALGFNVSANDRRFVQALQTKRGRMQESDGGFHIQ